MKEPKNLINISQAISALSEGKIIAYPTESCFGLGCDPKDQKAIERLLTIKSRSANKGLILIAGSIEQAVEYVDINESAFKREILESWPGPNTWLLSPKQNVLPILRGAHPLLAMRVTAHSIAQQLCQTYGGAIVSTSANLAGQVSLLDAESVKHAFAGIGVLKGDIGSDKSPSTIRDGNTGKILRP